MAVFVMRSHPAPRISVIIPSRDGRCDGNVPRLLQALEGQERIDDAEVLLVVGERPNGRARNVGAAAARGRFLVFIDDDAGLRGTRVLVELLAPLERGPRPGEAPIGMTGAATALPDDADRFQRRVAAALPRSLFPEVDQVTDTDMAHHLCCALPRRVWDGIGGESDTLETGTDVDLRQRLRAAGYRIVVVPRTVATHPQPRTLGALWRKHLWYGSGKVELHRLHPPAGRDVIVGGRGAAATYALRALLTFPLRVWRLDRASPWRFNPLLAVVDLAQKLGYARAFWHSCSGRQGGGGGEWLRSRSLERLLLPRRPALASPPDPRQLRRVLVVATAGLGDAILWLPALAALKAHFAGARFTAWVASAGAAEVLRSQGIADAIWLHDLSARSKAARMARKLEALLRLRLSRYQLAAVNFVNSTEEMGVLLRLGGVPARAGYVADPDTPSLFNLPVPGARMDAPRHAVQRHLDLLPVLGVSRPSRAAPVWRVSTAARATAGRFAGHAGGRRPVVGLHAGSGATMAWKRWPAERFVELARRLAAEGAAIWLFGGGDERALLQMVDPGVHAGAVDCCGADLSTTAALMEHCDLVVANDSGLYNLALAVGRPVVAVFGPTLPALTGPWADGPPAALLTRKVDCHPCIDPRRPPAELPCPVGRVCITGVSVDEVHAACRRLLTVRVAGTVRRPSPTGLGVRP